MPLVSLAPSKPQQLSVPSQVPVCACNSIIQPLFGKAECLYDWDTYRNSNQVPVFAWNAHGTPFVFCLDTPWNPIFVRSYPMEPHFCTQLPGRSHHLDQPRVADIIKLNQTLGNNHETWIWNHLSVIDFGFWLLNLAHMSLQFSLLPCPFESLAVLQHHR